MGYPWTNGPSTYRQLVVVNTKTRKVVATRDDNTCQIGLGCARITKHLFTLMSDGDHIAYFAHAPTEMRVPMKINGRYYAKPSKRLLDNNPNLVG